MKGIQQALLKKSPNSQAKLFSKLMKIIMHKFTVDLHINKYIDAASVAGPCYTGCHN